MADEAGGSTGLLHASAPERVRLCSPTSAVGRPRAGRSCISGGPVAARRCGLSDAMPRVFHIVVTDLFAGVERYVCDVASETAQRGWDVAVVGGDAERMCAALGSRVRWEAGTTPLESLRSVLRLGRWDVCHAHMTAAEAIALASRRAHRAVVVSTRHFAARRGASRAGHLIAPWITAGLTREIAIGEFVARHLERPPAAVVVSGVPESPCLWRRTSREVLVLQRLDPEKDTMTALRGWQASRLADEGWSLRVVGEGRQRQMLERCVEAEAISGVTFTGWTAAVSDEMERAGILLASAPAEPLGLAVLEAMAAGVPVVACASGGHLETVGLLAGASLFPPGDAAAAAAALRSLLSDAMRVKTSAEGRRLVAERFTIEGHVDRLLAEYDAACRGALLRRPHHARVGSG
jgi:glycosyltransferase involved in cell wall biosynthesis